MTWNDAIEKIKQVKQERDRYKEVLKDVLWMMERDSYNTGEVREAIRSHLSGDSND